MGKGFRLCSGLKKLANNSVCCLFVDNAQQPKIPYNMENSKFWLLCFVELEQVLTIM